jgi:hypothetical protein
MLIIDCENNRRAACRLYLIGSLFAVKEIRNVYKVTEQRSCYASELSDDCTTLMWFAETKQSALQLLLGVFHV